MRRIFKGAHRVVCGSENDEDEDSVKWNGMREVGWRLTAVTLSGLAYGKDLPVLPHQSGDSNMTV